MTVNIVLKSFGCPATSVLRAIDGLDYVFVTPGRAQGLRSLLPEPEDAKALRAFTGDRATLAEAESFEMALMEVGATAPCPFPNSQSTHTHTHTPSTSDGLGSVLPRQD